MPTITWTETRFLRVPLTEDEQRERGRLLARTLDELTQMEIEHKAERESMKDSEALLRGRIAHHATVVREGFEERSVPVEMRVDIGLGMVEEIRTDTGEIIHTRGVTADDKMRVSAQAQTEIPGTETKPPAPEAP